MKEFNQIDCFNVFDNCYFRKEKNKAEVNKKYNIFIKSKIFFKFKLSLINHIHCKLSKIVLSDKKRKIKIMNFIFVNDTIIWMQKDFN